jgi:hypothetical protein
MDIYALEKIYGALGNSLWDVKDTEVSCSRPGSEFTARHNINSLLDFWMHAVLRVPLKVIKNVSKGLLFKAVLKLS